MAAKYLVPTAAPRWQHAYDMWAEDDFEDAILEHLSPHVQDYFRRKLRDAFQAGMGAVEQALIMQGCRAAAGQADRYLKEFTT